MEALLGAKHFLTRPWEIQLPVSLFCFLNASVLKYSQVLGSTQNKPPAQDACECPTGGTQGGGLLS